MTDVSVEIVKTMPGCGVRPPYDVRELRMDQDCSLIFNNWKKCNARSLDDNIVCDPEWLKERCNQENANILVYLFERGTEIVGAVPVELYLHRLTCNLGDLTVARIPLRMARVLGYTPNLPAEESACDLLFERLLASPCDAIYMTGIRGDSFFWRYLHSSPLVNKHFVFYSERGLRPHPYIRMTGSFEEYMKKFTNKSRKNLSYRSRKLREIGAVELVKVAEEAQVDSFVQAASAIARKTYQFRVLNIGILDPERLKKWLKWAARQGWLRSYLLTCGGIPVAFQIAYQHNEKFLGVQVGYDPALSDLGVGITQQLLAVEDLFTHDTPAICDYGSYADYKQFLGNDAYPDALVWLFRKRPYPFLALSAYRLCGALSKQAGALLERVNLKSRVRRFMRTES